MCQGRTPHHTQSVLPKVTNLMLDQGIAEVGRLLGFIRLGRGGRGKGGARRGRVEEGGAEVKTQQGTYKI